MSTTRYVLALSLLVGGCVKVYQPPTLAEPHATLKVRRVFETAAGTHLREKTAFTAHIAEGRHRPPPPSR